MKKRSNKKKGSDFEQICKETINSGAINLDGDLSAKTDEGQYLIESKFTEAKGFKITLDMIEKAWEQGLSIGKHPRFIIGIKRNDKQLWMLCASVTLKNI